MGVGLAPPRHGGVCSVLLRPGSAFCAGRALHGARRAEACVVPFVSVRRVVQVGLHRRFCATQPAGYLGDREALLVAVVARERSSLVPFTHTITRGHRRATIAVAVDGYRRCWIVTGGTPRRCSAPRLDPRRTMVAFRGSGSRVVSRITIERFRLSSIGEEIGGLGLVPARTMRATAAECLLPVTSQAIRKHLRDRGVGAGVHPSSWQSATPSSSASAARALRVSILAITGSHNSRAAGAALCSVGCLPMMAARGCSVPERSSGHCRGDAGAPVFGASACA